MSGLLLPYPHYTVPVLDVDKDGDADASAVTGEVISSRARLSLAFRCPKDPDQDTSKTENQALRMVRSIHKMRRSVDT